MNDALEAEPVSKVAQIAFNKLCSVCNTTFARLGNHSRHIVAPFQSFKELSMSAEIGCHFCSLLVHKIKSDRNYDIAKGSTIKFSSELRFYRGLGISFRLCLRGSCLAYIDLRLDAAPEVMGMTFSKSANTRDEASWAQALKWIGECLDTHTECTYVRDLSRHQLPSRLIAVGSINSPSIRVCETSMLEYLDQDDIRYMTLSHCWGLITPTRLLQENYSHFIEGINLNELPKTFKEAIEVTRALNVAYLWIDSLCIVQDRVSDWDLESSKMHHIYKYSYLNLAAAASNDSSGGLFYPRNPLEIVPCVVKVKDDDNETYVSSPYNSERERRGGLVLSSRAWVFQEFIFAPRVLIFGQEELHWECSQLYGSETFPTHIRSSGYQGNQISLEFLRSNWREMHNKSPSWYLKLWEQVIWVYSGKKLTKSSDKLVAVAGLAAELGHTWKNVTYLAGLWSYRLLQSLLWRAVQFGPSRDMQYVAPSWSWASLNSTAMRDTYTFTEGLAEVLEARVDLKTANRYGEVVNGFVRIKGPLVRAKIVRSYDMRSWEIEFVDWGQETEKEEKGQGGDAYNNTDDNPDQGSDELPRTKIAASVCWDEKPLEEMTIAVIVYLAPLHTNLWTRSQRHEGLGMRGLLLLPTCVQRGEFRRVGLFSLIDVWTVEWDVTKLDQDVSNMLAAREEALDKATTADEILDSEIPTYGGRSRNFTFMDAEAVLIQRDREVDSAPRWLEPRELEKQQKIEERMRHFGEREITALEADSYCNGVIDSRLVGRFTDELGIEDYPNINACLSWTYCLSHLPVSDDIGMLPEEFYEAFHGDGYFTYRIV